MIDNNGRLVVIDVREQDEYCNAGPYLPPYPHIPDALNYPWVSGVLESNYSEIPNNSEILVVCRSGGRSAAASGFLCQQPRFESTPIYNMTGGMICWEGETVAGCCYSNDDCDDGLYCTGEETCVNLNCQSGNYPCNPYYCCDEESHCLGHTGDADCDGIPDEGGDHICTTGETENCDDNCQEIANGPFQGVCAKQINENLVIIQWTNCADDGDCEAGEFCEKNQLDSNDNDIGDACECEADFDCDLDQDWYDVFTFIEDWGRNPDNNPCPPCVPENESCEGDFDGDCDIDWDDVYKFLEDWGRNPENRPCPSCS